MASRCRSGKVANAAAILALRSAVSNCSSRAGAPSASSSTSSSFNGRSLRRRYRSWHRLSATWCSQVSKRASPGRQLAAWRQMRRKLSWATSLASSASPRIRLASASKRGSLRVTISLTAAGSLLLIRASSSTSGSVSFNRAVLNALAKVQGSADPVAFAPVPVRATGFPVPGFPTGIAHHFLPVARHPGIRAVHPLPVATVPDKARAFGGNHFNTLRRWRLADDHFGLGKGRGADKRGKRQRNQQGVAQFGQWIHGNSFIRRTKMFAADGLNGGVGKIRRDNDKIFLDAG